MQKNFSFGKNWQRYIKIYLNEDSINDAKNSLLLYQSLDDYKNKIFIDIGCGSGIFSLSALLLGCKEVYSFDIDKNSIAATKYIKEKFSNLIIEESKEEKKWEIFEGNILDNSIVNRFLEKGDIVYSWGVLHHTGNMWKAIENASRLVKAGGLFVLSIYNKTPSSNFWLKIKQYYNRSNIIIRFIMISVLFANIFIKRIILMKNPFKNERGMAVLTDVIDWLGGYPYEFASFEEVKDFVENLGFNLIKTPRGVLPSQNSQNFLDKIRGKYTGCNEFVFRRIK